MNKVWHLMVAIVAPLLAIFGVAFALYGVEGPPDTVRVNAAARLIGMGYGVNLVGAVFYWWKHRGGWSE